MERNDLISKAQAYIEASKPTVEPAVVSQQFLYDVRNRLSDDATTIASLSEALAEAEKKGAEDWQPIETAKAGELLLLFEPHSMGGFIFVGALNGVWFNNLDQKIQRPTMWRPLPAPPRDLSQGGRP